MMNIFTFLLLKENQRGLPTTGASANDRCSYPTTDFDKLKNI